MRTQSPYTPEDTLQTVQGVRAICDRLMKKNEQPPEGPLYPPDKDRIERLRTKYKQQKVTLLLGNSRGGRTVFAKQALEAVSFTESTNSSYGFADFPEPELAWFLTRLHGAKVAPIPERPGKADIEVYLQAHQDNYVVDSLESVEEKYLGDLLGNHYEWLTAIEADFHILFICRPALLEDRTVLEVPREYLFWSNQDIVGLFDHAIYSLNLPISSLDRILEELNAIDSTRQVLDAADCSHKKAIQLIDKFCGYSKLGGAVPTYDLLAVAIGFHDCFVQVFDRLEQNTSPGGQ